VEEYADLQCPVCARFSDEALLQLVDENVRTGRVRLVLRPLAFLGDDSVRGARVAAAAAQQDRAWGFVEGFYANQGEENSGYATDAFIGQQFETAGLNSTKTLAEVRQGKGAGLLDQWAKSAKAEGVNSTPGFLVGRSGGRLEQFQPQSLTVEAFTEKLDELVAAPG